MIGLVIIVILITLGLLFLAKFALTESPEKKIFVREGLAYSTMSALVLTTINEPTCSVRDVGSLSISGALLEDCAQNYDTDSQYQCQNMNTCDFLEKIIGEWLEATLGEWGYKYQFRADLIQPDTDPITIIDQIKECPAKKSKDGTTQPIHITNTGLVELSLYICS